MAVVRVAKSARSGIVWPALPNRFNAMVLALQHQLDESQWWPAETLLEHQMRQAEALISHAAGTVPFYGDRLGDVARVPTGELTLEHFQMLPILRRQDLQEAGQALASRATPRDHGRTSVIRTSGSTGRPVAVTRTAVNQVFYAALNLRSHFWHDREFGAVAASIRVLRGAYAEAFKANKPMPWVYGYRCGPMYFFDIGRTVGEQLDWLVKLDPVYLLTHPSNLRALLERSEETGARPQRLREVSTMTDALDPEVREACARVWGVPLHDAYSAQEVGFMALECPERPHYHVQSESVLVEVLDDDGAPCPAGRVGRVVVTDLHNFAMPLIRYDIADFAEVGEACSCGRGLLVLTRIVGRARNMLTLPSGERLWPSFGSRGLTDIAPIKQHQFVQKSVRHIEARLVTARPLTPEEEAKLREHILAKLSHPFEIAFAYHDDIPRSASGKFEDFLSEVTG